MLIVAGFLEVLPDVRDAYLIAASDATRLARKTPGCLEFVQAADPLFPDRIIVYERWASEEQLSAFRNSDPGRDAHPLPDIERAQVMRYEVSAIGPP